MGFTMIEVFQQCNGHLTPAQYYICPICQEKERKAREIENDNSCSNIS
jgi:hypothetical protein